MVVACVSICVWGICVHARVYVLHLCICACMQHLCEVLDPLQQQHARLARLLELVVPVGVDMCINIHVDMCLGICTDIFVDTCVGVCADMCVDMLCSAASTHGVCAHM